MNPEPGQAEPGNMDPKETGSREAQFAATHNDRPGERSSAGFSYGSGNNRRYQLPEGEDASCATRRRRSRNITRPQETPPPPPDWGPAVEGTILADSGWMTTGGRNVRVWVVRGTASGSLPEWSRNLWAGSWSAQDESGPLDKDSTAANTADPEGDSDLSGAGTPVRLPRKPAAPAVAVALELPVAGE